MEDHGGQLDRGLGHRATRHERRCCVGRQVGVTGDLGRVEAALAGQEPVVAAIGAGGPHNLLPRRGPGFGGERSRGHLDLATADDVQAVVGLLDRDVGDVVAERVHVLPGERRARLDLDDGARHVLVRQGTGPQVCQRVPDLHRLAVVIGGPMCHPIPPAHCGASAGLVRSDGHERLRGSAANQPVAMS
jgi:hypothetical protein